MKSRIRGYYYSKIFKSCGKKVPFINRGVIFSCPQNIECGSNVTINPQCYFAAKGGISALTHSLAVSLAGKARVNSISPGWIDTTGTVYQGADATQQPCGRVGTPMDIAGMVLFLCSDKAEFITGENICIDGGMTRLMIYHGDNGWSLAAGQDK